MLLYLVRHAIASPRSPHDPGGDFERALTPEGLKKMRRHADALRRMRMAPREIWSSPLVRARQTAEILAAGLDGGAAVVVTDALRPDSTPDDALAAIERDGHVDQKPQMIRIEKL